MKAGYGKDSSFGTKRIFHNKSGTEEKQSSLVDLSTRSASALIIELIAILKSKLPEFMPKTGTWTIVESIITVVVAHRSRRKVWFSSRDWSGMLKSLVVMVQTVASFEDHDNREQTFVKYWNDLLLHKLFRSQNAPPERHGWIDKPLYVGWLNLFVRRRLAKRDSMLFYSLQKGIKPMWPHLSYQRRVDTLKKHAAQMQEPAGEIPNDLYQMIVNTSSQIFNEGNPSRSDKILPSWSAATQARRQDGGARSLYKPYLLPTESSQENIAMGVLGVLPFVNLHFNSFRQGTFDHAYEAAMKQSQTLVKFAPDNSRGEGLIFCANEANKVRIVIIDEPSKHRTVSVGDGYLYTALQPLQGHLLTSWKTQKESTMLDEDLTERIAKINAETPDDWLWYSVDYESATNLLLRCTTMACLEGLKKHPLHHLAARSFGPNIIEYNRVMDANKKVLREAEKVLGTGAQLMGHPLSFPLLCVINLACYRTAIERWQLLSRENNRLGKKMWNRAIINGDDLVFKAPISFFPVIDEVTSSAGLKFSVGKNYLSEDRCMINSQLFESTWKLSERGILKPTTKRVGYLNLRLIKPFNIGEALPTEITRDINSLCHLVPEARCLIPIAMKTFGKSWFKGSNVQPNWFLPPHLGGCGLDPEFAPPGAKITKLQRILAAQIWKKESSLFTLRPVDKPAIFDKLKAAAMVNRRVLPPIFKDPDVGSYSIYGWEEIVPTTDSDDWSLRLSLLEDYMRNLNEKPIPQVNARLRNHSKKLNYFSDDDLVKRWEEFYVKSEGPFCPPLGSVQLPLCEENRVL
jgi:hypothetical protein